MRKKLFAGPNSWARFLSIAFVILPALLWLTACSPRGKLDQPDLAAQSGTQISATFGPDGRLWRATAGVAHVFVDVSSDGGQSFGRAVAVNRQAQRIHSSNEDRPTIAIDRANRVWVSYAAEAVPTTTAFFSYSEDGGASFSEPMPISDQAARARAFLAVLALDADGGAHFVWHDERDNANGHDHGDSLYYAGLDSPSAVTPVARRVLRTACERCPIKVAFDGNNQPVLFSRFVFPIKERDHGLVKMTSDGKGWSSWRVTHDNWEDDTCPEHGPAFAIAADGRYHIAWFTQGKNRQGLFYAWSKDQGKHFTPHLAFGDQAALAGHPALYSLGRQVALAWQEFDGRRTLIKAMLSLDNGEHWLPPKLIAQSKGAADYPLLIGDGRRIYLSWNSSELGYRLLPVD